MMIELLIENSGYVITNYFPPDSANYDGININNVLEYFRDITCYVSRSSIGVWIETQYLALASAMS